MLYFLCCFKSFSGKNLVWKDERKMNHNKLTSIKKSEMFEILLFLIVLVLSLISFFNNHMLVDAVYFVVVLTLFIKFLIVKLYH